MSSLDLPPLSFAFSLPPPSLSTPAAGATLPPPSLATPASPRNSLPATLSTSADADAFAAAAAASSSSNPSVLSSSASHLSHAPLLRGNSQPVTATRTPVAAAESTAGADFMTPRAAPVVDAEEAAFLESVASLDKEERLRRKAIREVVVTERDYVRDLNVIVDVFLGPFKMLKCLTDEQTCVLRANISRRHSRAPY
jgi:hypothetical protein